MRHALPASLLLVAAACGPSLEASASRPIHEVRSSRTDELRPTDTGSGEMWKFSATETVEAWGSDGGFLVHFTRDGGNAVPLADADDSGVPDLVEQTGLVYDAVADTYQRVMGFRAPLGDSSITDNGGDGRFDIYLLDFGLSSDGAFRADGCLSTNGERCFGYVVQENDFKGYGYPSFTVATRILGSHEYFHAVQDAYDANQGVVISEGTAVWATEQFDPSTNDFENFIDGYLNRPDRPLDSPPPGPVPSFAYGSAIFFEYLSERFEPAIVRKLWEHLENGHGFASEPADQADPTWLVQLDALLQADYGSSFAKAFTEFATWNLYMGSAADPQKGFKNGAKYPKVATTTVASPYELSLLRIYYASAQYFVTDPGGRTTMTAALVDDPTTAEDETADLALVLAVKQGGKIVTLAPVTAPKAGTQTVDLPANSLLQVVVVNTLRQGSGAVLSRRPGLCIGSVAEVQACQAHLNPALVPDVGAPDAGTSGVDAGTGEPPPPAGCGGCSATDVTGLAFTLPVLAALAARRRRSSP